MAPPGNKNDSRHQKGKGTKPKKNREGITNTTRTAGDLGTNRTCDKNEINYLCAAEMVNYAELNTRARTRTRQGRWVPWSMQQISAVGNLKNLPQISES